MTAFITLTPIKADTLREKMFSLVQDDKYKSSSLRYLRDEAIVNLVWNTTDHCEVDWKPTSQFVEEIEEIYPLPMFKDATAGNVIWQTKDWDNSKTKWCEALIDHDKENGEGIIYLVHIK